MLNLQEHFAHFCEIYFRETKTKVMTLNIKRKDARVDELSLSGKKMEEVTRTLESTETMMRKNLSRRESNLPGV